MSSPGVYFILFVFIGDVARLEARLETGSLSRLVFYYVLRRFVSYFGQRLVRTCCMNSNVMGVWARPSRPREQGNLGPCCRLSRRCLINRLLFVGANNRRRGSAGRILGARRAGMRTHNGMLSYVCAVCRLVCYRPSKRGTEDGVRDDGGWAGDTWYRRGAPPRPVVPVRPGLPFPEGERPAPGLAANHLVDTVR
ncbi:hypothetical protein EVAR_101280_1 [Eumeta japonica]|uniref:Uncharacterized protein n=1 Tax=Eumeta variegata TaxID=151549 RepID=A0A4C1S9C3_EUMVA|nr:hypothetical protein EVAR_101280_1 [Eumeta japonica]